MCNSKTNPGMISVIICTYNRSLLLKEAIDSALSQSYPLMEIIVLDGNSTDNTSDIMKQYESNLESKAELVWTLFTKEKG